MVKMRHIAETPDLGFAGLPPGLEVMTLADLRERAADCMSADFMQPQRLTLSPCSGAGCGTLSTSPVTTSNQAHGRDNDPYLLVDDHRHDPPPRPQGRNCQHLSTSSLRCRLSFRQALKQHGSCQDALGRASELDGGLERELPPRREGLFAVG